MDTVFPALHGNWVDFGVLLLLVYYIWEGLERGLILGTIDLGGFFLSFLSALKLYPFTANLLILNFSLGRGIANAAGFLLVGFLTQLALSFAVTLIYPYLPKALLKTRWNKWLGFIPSFGSGVIFASFFLTLIISLPVRGSLKSDVLAGKLSGSLVRQTQGVERDLKKIFGEAVNETMTFFTVAPQSQERVDLHFTQNEFSVSTADEQTMLMLVNHERQQQGLRLLDLNTGLQELARSHAKDMFERGYFSHYTPEGKSPFDRMEKSGMSYQAAGENLALAPNVTLAHQGLMNSPGHRANILSKDFAKIGIGAIDGGIYGVMFVQEFTD